MFTIHLTPERYYFNVMAGRFAEGKDHPDFLHVAYENQPNLKLGDEVEVVVSDGKGYEVRHVGEVAEIQKPREKLAGAELARQDLQQAAARQQFIGMFGIDPAAFPTDDYTEQKFQSQWYVLLRHKETKDHRAGNT